MTSEPEQLITLTVTCFASFLKNELSFSFWYAWVASAQEQVALFALLTSWRPLRKTFVKKFSRAEFGNEVAVVGGFILE